MSETLPCHYTSTALMSVMGFFQSTLYALFGWDIRLWTAAYSGIMGTALVVTLTAICSRLKGPLFVAIFNPLVLVIVAVACVLFLDEKLYLGSVLGAILIVSGVYIVLWGKNKEMSGLVPSEELEIQIQIQEIARDYCC
ncbi:WAT1-related protein [Cardamine amara subsp. amara]|uniref:WAT1-related protein n=1 Tax=Cardamine amara subsp. amara TaxID=228776 RepID=A0ABD0ZUH7_CARAN